MKDETFLLTCDFEKILTQPSADMLHCTISFLALLLGRLKNVHVAAQNHVVGGPVLSYSKFCDLFNGVGHPVFYRAILTTEESTCE